jgi:hypothetical protein
MKKTKLFLLTAVGVLSFMCANAQVNPNNSYISGYTKSDGTTVQGYYKTDANSTNRDNYTTKPNTNPYTGTVGYIEPDNEPSPTSSYTAPAYNTRDLSPVSSTPIQTGSRGGQYYINSNGNKTYIKRN